MAPPVRFGLTVTLLLRRLLGDRAPAVGPALFRYGFVFFAGAAAAADPGGGVELGGAVPGPLAGLAVLRGEP